MAQGRPPTPAAVTLDSRTLQSTTERGDRAGYDGSKRKKGAKVHVAVDTLGQREPLPVTPANFRERSRMGALAGAVQAATGQAVEVAFIDQGYTGDEPAPTANAHGMRLEVVDLPAAERGFVLFPRRWVVERSFAWTGWLRRLARDDNGLQTTSEGFHDGAVALLALHTALPILATHMR